MNILVEVNACKITGNELAQLPKGEITKFVTVRIGKDVLPNLQKKNPQDKNIEDIKPENKKADGYNDIII